MSSTDRQMTWDEVVAQMVAYRNERDVLSSALARSDEKVKELEGALRKIQLVGLAFGTWSQIHDERNRLIRQALSKEAAPGEKP